MKLRNNDGVLLLIKYPKKKLNKGPDVAQNEFIEFLVNVPLDPYLADLSERLSGNAEFFFKHELRGFFGYLPKTNNSIRNSKVNIVIAVGAYSKDPYYVQATRALASELLGDEIKFSGHNDVCFWMSKEFANTINSTPIDMGISIRLDGRFCAYT